MKHHWLKKRIVKEEIKHIATGKGTKTKVVRIWDTRKKRARK